ncbi:MAG: serine/threonine protein kinase [candidate division Zixibacteria bacterium]|nr:serine/threonine protein kinase [candidate division Zixibacteria bacterium]
MMSSNTHGRFAQFAAVDNPDLPERFQTYILDKNPIGEGAVSFCYRARRTDNQQAVRLKVLRRRLSEHTGISEILQRQVRYLREFRGEALLPFRGAGQHAGIQFLEYDLVDGVSLRRVIDEHAPLHPDLVGLIGLGIGEALTQIHGMRPSPGLGNLIPLHRNLKPENVLLTPDGRVLLLDIDMLPFCYFADRQQIELPYTPQVYESPEQLLKSGYADRRSDIYSLGLIMLEMATAQHPFVGHNIFEARQNIREGRGVKLESLYPQYRDADTRSCLKDLGEIIGKMTTFAADKRPATVADLEGWLAKYFASAGYDERGRTLADFLRAGTFRVERTRKKTIIDRLFGG